MKNKKTQIFWLAADEDGECYLYTTKPTRGDNYRWHITDRTDATFYSVADAFAFDILSNSFFCRWMTFKDEPIMLEITIK